jgi:adenylate kinase family enzyme
MGALPLTDNSDLGRKILVAGQGGKSTLARAIAADLGLPFIELDAIYWLPNWGERTTEDFREQVQKAIDEHPAGWVIDGNYGGPLEGQVARQAETVIYVNMPWRVLFWRTFWRSIARAYDKRIICGDNTESWRKTFFSSDSLLWYLIRNRSRYGKTRTNQLSGWCGDARMIELVGRGALDEFYEERGLVR